MPLAVYDAQGNLKDGQSLPLPVGSDIWHEVGNGTTGLGTTFANSWVNFGGGEVTAAFRKYPDGKVRLRGLITKVSGNFNANETIWTLPLGYRPPTTRRFTWRAAGTTGTEVAARLDVFATGEVRVVTGGSANPVSYGVLDEIEFDTESVFQAPAVMGVPLVTSLAGLNPYEGMIVDYLADAANNLIWALRYRVGVGWLVRGGPALFAEDFSSLGLNTTLSAAQIPITIPAAGVYDFAWGHRGYNVNNAGASTQLFLYLNGVAQRVLDAWQGTAGSSITLWAGNTMRKRRLTVTTAGHVADLRAIVSAGSGTSEERWLEVRPVRLT